MSEQQIEDLIPFYALGTLTEQENTQVENYLAGNPHAQAELDEARYAVSALSFSAAPVTPPLRLKQEVADRVEAEAGLPVSRPMFSTFSLASFIEALGFRSGWGLVAPGLAVASLVVALVAGIRLVSLDRELNQLRQTVAAAEYKAAPIRAEVGPLRDEITIVQEENGILKQELAKQRALLASFSSTVSLLQEENGSLQDDLAIQSQDLAAVNAQVAALSEDKVALTTRLNEASLQADTLSSLSNELGLLRAENVALLRELSVQREVMAHATSPDVQAMTILGTENLPQARGQLIANPANAAGVLIVSGLPVLEEGLVYRFWLVQAGAPVAVGNINVDDRGLGTLIVTSNSQIGSFDGMGVSIELQNADPAPSSEMIMLGNFSSL